MAVTIDELQIDVKSGGKQGGQAPAAAPPKRPGDPRQQTTLLAERRARLNTE